jgi:hypothetical protein
MSFAEPFVYPLSNDSESDLYVPSGFGYNYAIDGLPFLSAADKQNPYTRQTAQNRKPQFDNSGEAGEQSLEGWWLRSQQSFHGGSDQLYLDPSDRNEFASIRFWQSRGVDPWTDGELKLLKQTEDLTGDQRVTEIVSGGDVAIGVDPDSNEVIVFEAGAATPEASPATASQSVTLDGTYFYVAGNDGIWRRLISGGGWSKIWDIVSTPATVRIAWVKERLVLATTLGIYELASGGPALPAVKWSPPSGSWIPQKFTEGGTAIYCAGYVESGASFILKFTLEAAGTMPTLTSGVVVAQLPGGESVHAIYGYLGAYMAIGTSLGARIAAIDTDGNLTVGPLLWEGATRGFCGRGSFIYAAVTSEQFVSPEAGIFRVDLSTDLGGLRFPYAADLVGLAGDGITYDCAHLDGRLLFGCEGAAFYEHDTDYLESGWLQTSRIRYNTLEPKAFVAVRIRGLLLPSGIQVEVVPPTGSNQDIIGYAAGSTPGEFDAAFPSLGPLDYVSLLFTLESPEDFSDTPIITGYTVKALPATPRHRLIRTPVWCFDHEKDRFGNVAHTSAYTRLLALEEVDRTGGVIMLQDLDAGTATEVVLEEMEFRQTAPPDGLGHSGYGGIITIIARTV